MKRDTKKESVREDTRECVLTKNDYWVEVHFLYLDTELIKKMKHKDTILKNVMNQNPQRDQC